MTTGARRLAAWLVGSITVGVVIVALYFTGWLLAVAFLAPAIFAGLAGPGRRLFGLGPPTPREPRDPTAPRVVALIAAATWLLGAIALGASSLLEHDASPISDTPPIGVLAGMFAVPGILTLLGIRRPGLLLAAAVLGFVQAPWLWSLAGFALILSLASLWCWERTHTGGSSRAGIAALASVLLFAGAWWALNAQANPRCFTYRIDAEGNKVVNISTPASSSLDRGSGSGYAESAPDGTESGGGCTGDVTTTSETAGALIFLISIPAVGVVIVPRRSRREFGYGPASITL